MKTCSTNMTCSVTQTSKYTSVLSFGCKLKRPTNKVYVSFLVKKKTFLNISLQIDAAAWHQKFGGTEYQKAMDLPKLDWCNIMENAEKFPLMMKPVAWVNLTFPNLVHKCPYTVCWTLFYFHQFSQFLVFQSFESLNASLKIKESNLTNKGWLNFIPRGNWKLTLKPYDDLDDEIAQLACYYIFR